MIKFLFDTVLIIIIIFFVWNILKRLFLKTFYPGAFNRYQKEQEEKKQKKSVKKKKMENLNWDAETVDYEEVKNKDDQKEQDNKK